MSKKISKHFKIPNQYLLNVYMSHRDGIIICTDIRDGYIYCYNNLTKKYSKGFNSFDKYNKFATIFNHKNNPYERYLQTYEPELKSVKTKDIENIIKNSNLSKRRKSSHELKGIYYDEDNYPILDSMRELSKGNFEFQTDMGETIIVQFSRNENFWMLHFKRKGDNRNYYEQPNIRFVWHEDHLRILYVISGDEHGLGWCSLMIQVLMYLVEKWRSEGDMDIHRVSIENNSLLENNGNPAGTWCYVKNIGMFYPIFKVSLDDDNDLQHKVKKQYKSHDLREYNFDKFDPALLKKIDIDIYDKYGDNNYVFYKA